MMEIRYLNTDLDIESNEDLTPIIEAFGEQVFILHHGLIKGRHRVSFELSYDDYSIDEAIRSFCDLIENLPPTGKMIWNRCITRVIDVGIESGASPQCYRFELPQSTINRVSATGASLAVSIYAIPIEEK